MKSTVSLLAIAVAACLAASCATTAADDRRRRARDTRRPPPAAARGGDADRRRGRRLRRPGRARAGRVHRHLQPRPMGQRDLHHARHRRARRPFRHDRHRDGRALRQRGGALRQRARPRATTRRRKLNILRSALTLPAPTTAGAAAELNRISTDLSSQYGRGRGTMDGAAR